PVNINTGSGDRPTKRSGEGWDDELPLGGPGFGPKVEFGMYDDKPPEQELQYIGDLLKQTDYIFIASNRLYGSLDNLPWRYPVQNKFYELLFGCKPGFGDVNACQGKLGFEHVYVGQVTPSLFGINFDDQTADESFTVYDHPRVDVFKKTNDLTDEQLQMLFSAALNRPGGA